VPGMKQVRVTSINNQNEVKLWVAVYESFV